MTPEEIKEALDKSGYLFEQKVATVIEEFGFHANTNKAFLDPEENKSREIDVVAHKEVFKIKNNINPPAYGICYINCECKNSKTPLVFITRKKGDIDKNYTPNGIHLVYNYYFKSIASSRITPLDAFHYLQLHEHHYATKSDTQAVQICKIIQNGKKVEAQHGGIIEGFIYPLIKSQKIWEAQTPRTNDEKIYCRLFFNLVVVSSQLFTIDSNDDNAMPVETDYVPFIREIQNKDLKGKFLITFVTFSGLKKFLSTEVEDFCKKVEAIYIQKPQLLYDEYLR